MSKRYITTTLPYVNASPHLGFALEIVQADVLARTWREMGDEVFFSTGTDEHGQKIYGAAQKRKENVQDYVNYYASEFKHLHDALELSNDAFIRTSNPAHEEAAQEMWRRCNASGDIYKKEYEGLYCVGHEAFITEKELVDGKCPEHGTEPQRLSEENYFFRFSAYQDRLLDYLTRNGCIIPEWRHKEALSFVKGGLEDFPISREKKRLSWGVEVPGDNTQVMYVWWDALTNYLSTLGWPNDKDGLFKSFWQEGLTVQMAGKDQVRFQSLMWQAMLMSAKIKNTETVFYHGFIKSGGRKMSKSLGNVINPYDMVDAYGADTLRYVLLRHVSPVEDSDLTSELIREYYTAHLTNGLGNLVARVMKLAEEHLPYPARLSKEDEHMSSAFTEKVVAFRFNEALDLIFADITVTDAFMTRNKPFTHIKSGDAVKRENARKDIEELVRKLARIAANLMSAMPRTAVAITEAIHTNQKPENLFPRLPISKVDS